jgi:hypothetical protein
MDNNRRRYNEELWIMSNMIDKYDNLTGYKQKFSKLDVKSHFPKLKESDYNKGFIIRYFVQKVNDLNSPIYEISSSSYSSYNNNPFFIASAVRWRIVGPKETVYDEDGSIVDKSVSESNRISINLQSKKIANLKLYLPNLLQFYKS